MLGGISASSFPIGGFVIVALPVAVLVALLVSRRVRDGRWRAVLRVTLAVYRPWPFPGPTSSRSTRSGRPPAAVAAHVPWSVDMSTVEW